MRLCTDSAIVFGSVVMIVKLCSQEPSERWYRLRIGLVTTTAFISTNPAITSGLSMIWEQSGPGVAISDLPIVRSEMRANVGPNLARANEAKSSIRVKKRFGCMSVGRARKMA